ncbi:MAG: energy transducer TonB [Gammaproteobacteria bacterium]|nr:energy transducer TonB [Gammaproteobacteria bacterium]
MLKRYLSLATAVAFSLGMSAQTHASEMTSAYQQYQQAVSTGNTTQAFKYALQALNAGKQEYAAESDNLFALQYNYAVAAGQVGKYDIAVDQFETLADLAAQQFGTLAVKTLATRLDWYKALLQKEQTRKVKLKVSGAALLMRDIVDELEQAATAYPADAANMYYMVASTLLQYGSAQFSQQRVADTVNQGLKLAITSWGEQDMRTLEQRYLLGRLSYAAADFNQVVAILEPLTATLDQHLNYTHPLTLQARALMLEAYEHLSQPEKARQHSQHIAQMKPWQAHLEPVLLLRKMPRYPQVATDLTGDTSVKVTFDISAAGNVENVRISDDSAGSKVFRHSAMEAVQQWRYMPRFVDGKAVETEGMTVSVDFDSKFAGYDYRFNHSSTDYVKAEEARLRNQSNARLHD